MFNEEEMALVRAFNSLDLLKKDNGNAFINFCHNVLSRDPSNRQQLLAISANVKRRWLKGMEMLDKPDVAECCSVLYWNLLLVEARHHFLDSYLLYLERKRRPKDKFYAPKRKCFIKIGLIQALQDLIDDKADLLAISMPPGTGKAQAMYSKVLTPSGFIQMKDVKVGTEVISGTGNVCKVLGVYPQGVKPVYEVTLENGLKCRCSGEHLWNVRYNYFPTKYKEQVLELNSMMWNPSKYLIPVTTASLRNTFHLRIGSIEYVGDEECQCIYIDDPSHLYITDDYIITHNTTVLKFFHSAVAGWYPDGFSLFWTHSDDIARMYYDGVYDIVSNDLEYTWHEIFPELEITKTNAKMEQFNVGAYKPFPSIQCTSTGAKNAGKVRANQYLIVDDMIGNIEEALNKNTLDKLWTAYTVNAMQRKVPRPDERPCKEIHCATRWSVNDVIGRLQRAFENDPRAKFIAIPDVDPKTGKSNFSYDVGGFSERFFQQQALLMDDISYRCLYKQDPIEREGLLYTEDDIRFYHKLPAKEPDAVLAVCDTKSTGADWMVMPVLNQYGSDFYLVDCICDDSTNFQRQYRRLAETLVNNKVQQCEFEANAGGSRVAFEVNKKVEEMGHYCNITSKTTLTNKETRIIVNSDFIKAHVLFKDKEYYTRKSDYGNFMAFLLGYSVAGRNAHDDVPDAMSAFALFVQKLNRVRPAVIMESPI